MLKVEKVLSASARRLTGAIEPSGGSGCEAAEAAAGVGIALKYEAAASRLKFGLWVYMRMRDANPTPRHAPIPLLTYIFNV